MDERKFVMEDGRELVISGDDLEFIFKGMRPRLMPYEDFKYVRSVLKKELKDYLKGSLVHLSKLDAEAWKLYVEKQGIKGNIHQKGNTYVKKRK